MSTSTQPLAETQIGVHPPNYRLPATAHVGRVRIGVSNLERSVAFYSQIIGLAVLTEATAETRLTQLGAHGDTRVLLELEELPGVQPIGKAMRLGLYHTAFLLPTREALSSFVQHLTKHNVRFGAGDHLVSEALYLTDPDGLQVEVYADRPRSTWRVEAREIVMATDPVRFGDMPAVSADSWHGAPIGTTVGHVHLYIGDLQQAAAFYHAALGLDVVTWRYPGALFTSAGGYHHHIGLNIWAKGSPVASEADARLLFWELALPSDEEVERVSASLTAAGYQATTTRHGARAFTDPWGITVALVVV